jgi:hypothetical protein
MFSKLPGEKVVLLGLLVGCTELLPICHKYISTGDSKHSPDTSQVCNPYKPSLVKDQNTSDDLDLRIGSIISNSSLMKNSRKLEWLNRKRHMAIVTTASLP